MSLPNSSALRSTHSRRGGRGGRPGGGLGRSLSSSVCTRHSPHLSEHSAGVASAATTQQGRGAGVVSPMAMAYSIPARTLTFSKVLATSQGHSVSSLSQSCDNIHSWISLSGDLAFSHQDGIYGFKFPKRFLEISSRDLTLFSILII